MQAKTGVAQIVICRFGQLVAPVVEKLRRIFNARGLAVDNLVDWDRNLKNGAEMEKLQFKGQLFSVPGAVFAYKANVTVFVIIQIL